METSASPRMASLLPSPFPVRISTSNTSFSDSQSLLDCLIPSLSFSFLKNQIQNERHSVHDGFKQLRGILDSEEQRELQKLKKEEGEALHYLAEAENELVQQKQLVKVLISDLERRLKGSKMEMLQVRLGMKPSHLRFEENENLLSLLCYCALSRVVTLRFLCPCSTPSLHLTQRFQE